MSKNSRGKSKVNDVRVQRTRERLGRALLAPAHERRFDEIKVKHVLEQSGVSRSAFYVHFRDTTDLFLAVVDEFFESISAQLEHSGETSERLLPAREIFAHVAEMWRVAASKFTSGGFPEHLDLVREHFVRAIERRLRVLDRSRDLSESERSLTAQALAGGLTTLIPWWLRRSKRATPEEMDRAFHKLAWDGLSGRCEISRS